MKNTVMQAAALSPTWPGANALCGHTESKAIFSNRFPFRPAQPFRGMAAKSAALRPRVFGRRPAWLLGILGVVALALALSAAGALLTPADLAQAQDGSAATITAGPVIASSPQSGDTYGKGETITVTLTFSKSVTVTGEPRVRLEVGERKRWARYSAGSGSATLSFAYTVKKVDADPDGISIGADRLQLNGGSIADADGNDAALSHPALADQAGHKVDGSQEVAPADQRQQQAPPTFAADAETRSVDEDAAVGTNVGNPVNAVSPDGDALDYDLFGSDAFAIGASSGQIKVQSALTTRPDPATC